MATPRGRCCLAEYALECMSACPALPNHRCAFLDPCQLQAPLQHQTACTLHFFPHSPGLPTTLALQDDRPSPVLQQALELGWTLVLVGPLIFLAYPPMLQGYRSLHML